MHCKRKLWRMLCLLMAISFCLFIYPRAIESQMQGTPIQLDLNSQGFLSRKDFSRKQLSPKTIMRRPDNTGKNIQLNQTLMMNPTSASQKQPGVMPMQTLRPPTYREGEVLVSFKKPASMTMEAFKQSVDAKLSTYRLSVIKRFPTLSQMKGKDYLLVRGEGKAASEIYSMLKEDPDVDAVSFNYCRQLLTSCACEGLYPNDELFGVQWHLSNQGQDIICLPYDPTTCWGGTPDADEDATEAWEIRTDSDDVVVVVLDTGVDYTHPDLAGNMWVNQAEAMGIEGEDDDGNGYVDDVYGYDFGDYDPDPKDIIGHGTHVAGSIGAVGHNGIGVAGINWNARIMAVKLFPDDG